MNIDRLVDAIVKSNLCREHNKTDEEKEQWCMDYIKTLMEQGNMTIDEANSTLSAMGKIPYNDDPVDCANEELSNYGD